MHHFSSVIFSFSFFMFISLSFFSQENCERSSDLWRDYKRFIPEQESAVFTIKVNYVIPQKSDGTGNFSEDDEDVIYLFEHSFKTINKLWSKLKEPEDKDCYPHDDFLNDTFIRFELNEVIFVQNDHYWNADNGSGCPNNNNWWLNELEEEIRQNPKYDNAINVYMPNLPEVYQELVIDRTLVDQPDGKSPCSELPSNSDLNRSSRINMAGGFNKYWWMKNVVPTSETYNSKGYPWNPSIRSWLTGSSEHTLAHELGHSMGLSHANEFHGRNKCDESIMNQGFGKPHNYLQPTEIGKIHRNLRMSNIRNFLSEDVYSLVPFLVDTDTEFSMDFRSYEDIIVKDGATMTVRCALSLPERAKIVVEPGGTLIIREAQISHRTSLVQPMGIEVQKERGFFLFKKSKRKKGSVRLEEGGTYLGKTYKKKVSL